MFVERGPEFIDGGMVGMAQEVVEEGDSLWSAAQAGGAERFTDVVGCYLNRHQNQIRLNSNEAQGLRQGRLTDALVQAIGYGYVFHDLGAEEFGGVELFFFTDVVEEADFDAVRRGIGHGIEQEGFYRQVLAVEGWAVAYVRDRTELIGARHVDSGLCYVDSRLGEKFVFGG